MKLQQFKRQNQVTYQIVEHDDGVEHVADIGADWADASVDVVDDTVIVVTGDDQYEIALPDGDAEAFIRNGVLTIAVEDSA